MSEHIPLVVVSEEKTRRAPEKPLRLRSFSPIFYLYPSVVMAIACGIGSGFGHRTSEDPGKLGLVFTLFFFVNLTVITFEYTKKSSLAVLGFSILMGVLGWQSDMVAHLIKTVFDHPLLMNATYYWIWGMFLLLLIAFAWVSAQITHWRVEGDQFIKKSMFKQQESHSVANLTITVEVNDVLEYALLRSGQITVYQGAGIPLVRLRHVVGVKRIGARLQAAFEDARRAMPHAVPVPSGPMPSPAVAYDPAAVPVDPLPAPQSDTGSPHPNYGNEGFTTTTTPSQEQASSQEQVSSQEGPPLSDRPSDDEAR